MILYHDERCTAYGSSMRPEQPARLARTAPWLRQHHPAWTWRAPVAVDDELLRRGHDAAHLRRLVVPRDFDADTPWLEGIAAHARRAVGAAWGAAQAAVAGDGPAIGLMRPPGHHATADQAMGFCYLNSIALAALAARAAGVGRVAVWDFDAHHGNGTEAILRGREGFVFCSVHQSPCYPGTGLADMGNARNWPVPPRAARETHLSALRASFEAVIAFRPELVLVSAGFDAFARDPITDMTLEADDFSTLGQWLRECGRPAAAVLEGGYSDDLPQLVDAFLSAWTAEDGVV